MLMAPFWIASVAGRDTSSNKQHNEFKSYADV
jgi:hypothetical protein